jgi:hypothetical protein
LHSYANAGTIGLGNESPIWSIQNDDVAFDINMANYNNWTFAEPDWIPVYNTSTMNLGFNASYPYYDSINEANPGAIFIGEAI